MQGTVNIRRIQEANLVVSNKRKLFTGDIMDELVDSFFEAEVEMERKICRDVVCTSHRDEEGKRT